MTIALLALILPGVGCGSPPGVGRLMAVVRGSLVEEAGHVEAEAARDAQRVALMRGSLDDGFGRDLVATATLTPDWVLEAVTAYVAAREAVLRQEIGDRAARDRRIANLKAAAALQERAMTLLATQDRLLDDTLGFDLWRLDGDDMKKEDAR